MNKPIFLFDMSGVLLDFDLDVIRKKVAENSTLSLNQVCNSWENEKYVKSESGTISSKDFFDYYSRKINLSWSYERWIDEWGNICSPNKNGLELFKCLREKGYQVCILSNLAEYHRIAVEQKFPGFWNDSSINFLSYEMKLLKPNPKIYHTVCSQLRRSPTECIYFDDVIENINAAREIGLWTFHFSPKTFDSLLPWLNQQGVEL